MEQYYQTILGASIALVSSVIILLLSHVLQNSRERRTRENLYKATRINEIREAIVKVHDFICRAEYSFSEIDTNRENFKLFMDSHMEEILKIRSIIVPSIPLLKVSIHEQINSFFELATEVLNKIHEAEERRFNFVERHMDKYVLDTYIHPDDDDKATLEKRIRNDEEWQKEKARFKEEIQAINRRATLAYGKLIKEIDFERLK